ncbi:MAG: hypothetical protein A3G24_17880 [Betaproteobacteria bacterium RIFCSPLOWO2_12_FULL_62_13]|nr:MAG: hypothetical protein A3G24_17880 [Betaproteobacteria bacterium RIFCSPLOWO2_12_FULL_62_13]
MPQRAVPWRVDPSRLTLFLDPAVERRAASDHGFDIVAAVTDLPQDLDAVLAKLGRGQKIAARPRSPLGLSTLITSAP